MRYTIGGKEIVRDLCLHIAPVEIPAGFLIDPLSNFGLEKARIRYGDSPNPCVKSSSH